VTAVSDLHSWAIRIAIHDCDLDAQPLQFYYDFLSEFTATAE
jgi:hypothetical protein